MVDGGSEFISNAKGAASNSSSRPPKRSDFNGCVERAQSTWRYEFYAVYDVAHTIEKVQACVDAFTAYFNTQRPHEALAGLTPAEYLKSRSFEDPESLMCTESGHVLDRSGPLVKNSCRWMYVEIQH
jgi:hypothetical protein